MFILYSSANVICPVPTEEMVGRRHQILGMRFGMRSLNYLLEEEKRLECDLVGAKEYTNNDYYKKYSKWDDVPVPRNYVDPAAGPLEFNSPVSTKSLKRTATEQEGMDRRTMNLWSPTLLRIEPSQLVNIPRCPYHNFLIWANVDLYVHRYDSILRSVRIKYNTDEY